MTISVVIPTYERPELLKRLLASIAKQSKQPEEVIVVDDRSMSQAAYKRVIEEMKSQLPQLVFIAKKERQGPCHSRNIGIKRARGEWIALVDDDDEWLPTKLERQAQKAAESSKETGLIYTYTLVQKKNEAVRTYTGAYEGAVLPHLLLDNFIPSPSVLVKKEALETAGLFDQEMPSCQDWDMWTRILASGYHAAVVKSIESIYHQHDLPSVGLSPLAEKGYRLYFQKHLGLYRKHHRAIYWKHRLRAWIKSLIGYQDAE